MLKAYEEQVWIGQTSTTTRRQLNPDEDKSEVLREREKISRFRSIVGTGIYLCQERYDVAFTVKEVASRKPTPTAMSLRHLKNSWHKGNTMDCCLVVEFPQAGEGYAKKGESYWCLETFRFRLGWKQRPQKVNIRRIPRIE